MTRSNRKDLVRDSATKEERLLAASGIVILRSSDLKPLAFGRDEETIHRLARRIQPVGGEWKAIIERRCKTGATR